jgi:hypothetical protein
VVYIKVNKEQGVEKHFLIFNHFIWWSTEKSSSRREQTENVVSTLQFVKKSAPSKSESVGMSI